MDRPRTLRIGGAIASVACLALLRCSAFSEDGVGSSGGMADAAAESEPVDASALDAGADGAPADAADAEPPRACDSGCAGTAGPCEVRVGTLCIDATEVTNADYATFVAKNQATPIVAGSPCGAVVAKNVGTRPDPLLPVTGVTFCEARAYCIYAGKHLCGDVGGGPTSPANVGTLQSAWYYACTAGTGQGTVLSGQCQLDTTEPARAGSTCEGSPKGVFDMVGNVNEWVDSVDDAGTGANFVGAGYMQPTSSNCGYVSGESITAKFPDVGFRCCSF
jgi:sulfatase modifying factor 1